MKYIRIIFLDALHLCLRLTALTLRGLLHRITERGTLLALLKIRPYAHYELDPRRRLLRALLASLAATHLASSVISHYT